MFDIFIIFMMILLCVVVIIAFIAKRRIDNNEPVMGWKRKQFLAEQRGENIQQQNSKKKAGANNNESLKDVIGIKDIRYGVIEKQKNEYCVVLSSDFVNFDLLNPSEQGSIILGYQTLFRVINFPVQILGQAVRQDFRKEELRFNENLKKCNPQTREYNRKVIDYIRSRTINDFRISRRVYYVISYIYEPAKMAKLTKEQKEMKIVEALYQRAMIVRAALKRAKIETNILDSLRAMEVLKRALNRDRMIFHPIEDIAAKEKMTTFITVDPTTLPGFEDLVQDYEEATEIVKEFEAENDESEEYTYTGTGK